MSDDEKQQDGSFQLMEAILKREFAWVNPVNKISNVARTVAHRFKEKKIVRHCNLKKLL